MSSNYSANQYEGAFKPQRLQMWWEPKPLSKRPAAQRGHTAFIADDRGHLLPGVPKKGSAWPDCKGIWDLPAHIPAHHVNPTGRSACGLNQLRSWGRHPQYDGQFQRQEDVRCSDELQDDGKHEDSDVTHSDIQCSEDVQQVPAASPEAQPQPLPAESAAAGTDKRPGCRENQQQEQDHGTESGQSKTP